MRKRHYKVQKKFKVTRIINYKEENYEEAEENRINAIRKKMGRVSLT
jgi:hypothetical protein